MPALQTVGAAFSWKLLEGNKTFASQYDNGVPKPLAPVAQPPNIAFLIPARVT